MRFHLPLRRVWPLVTLLACLSMIRLAPAVARSDSGGQCDRLGVRDTAALERCLALHQDDVGLLIDLGRQMERRGDRVQAEELYRRALRFDPHDPEVHVQLGTLLLARGDRAGARTEAREALKAVPHNSAAGQLARLAGEPE
jgi:tetratricopeptide (TPR) repeat protein